MKIQIAIAINGLGDWWAWGASGYSNYDMMNEVSGQVIEPYTIDFIQADVDVPNPRKFDGYEIQRKRITEALSKVIKNEAIEDWLNKANNAFEGRTPIELIESGEIDRLWRMIYFLESGEPSN